MEESEAVVAEVTMVIVVVTAVEIVAIIGRRCSVQDKESGQENGDRVVAFFNRFV